MREQLPSRLAVCVFTGKGSAIADDKIRCFPKKFSKLPDSLGGFQIESQAGMHAALTEVSVQSALVIVLVQKFF